MVYGFALVAVQSFALVKLGGYVVIDNKPRRLEVHH